MSRTKNQALGCAAWIAACVSVLSASGGCATRDAEPSPEVGARAASLDAPRRAQRGKVIGGERVRRTIVAPPAAARDALALARYAADVQDSIARSPVPVLAPADPGPRATMAVGDHWYALTVHGDGFVVVTHGSGEARVHPHVRTVEPTHPMRTDGGFLTRNDGIWAASWIERGAAYSLEVECDRRVVAWCDDEAEILRRVEALVLVGEEA
jgi:hypothetical protein